MRKLIFILLTSLVLMGCKKENPSTEVLFTFNREYAETADVTTIIFEYDESGKNINSYQVNHCHVGKTRHFLTQPDTKQLKVYLNWDYNLTTYSAWVMHVYQVNGGTIDIVVDNDTVLGQTEP